MMVAVPQDLQRKIYAFGQKTIKCVFTDACDDAAGGSFGRDCFFLSLVK